MRKMPRVRETQKIPAGQNLLRERDAQVAKAMPYSAMPMWTRLPDHEREGLRPGAQADLTLLRERTTSLAIVMYNSS